MYIDDEGLKLPLRLLTVSETSAPVNCIIEQVDYKYLLVEYVLKGEGFVEIDSQRHICKKDSLYILPPGLDHQYGSMDKDPWEKIFFICEGELIEHLLTVYNCKSTYFLDDCADMLHFFREFSLLQNEIGVHINASLLLHKFFQEIFLKRVRSKNKRHISPLSAKLKIELDRSLERKINLDILSKELGTSKIYMIRKFKNDFGTTPYEYLLNKRIESAKIMLTHTSLFIKEIAEKLCFSDQYHFSNYFKKKTGTSPQNFR